MQLHWPKPDYGDLATHQAAFKVRNKMGQHCHCVKHILVAYHHFAKYSSALKVLLCNWTCSSNFLQRSDSISKDRQTQPRRDSSQQFNASLHSSRAFLLSRLNASLPPSWPIFWELLIAFLVFFTQFRNLLWVKNVKNEYFKQSYNQSNVKTH